MLNQYETDAQIYIPSKTNN